MKSVESYAERPFESLNVSRDKIVKFHGDHRDRLHQAVQNGEPFEGLLPGTDQKYGNLLMTHSATRTTGTQLRSHTINVDQVLQQFKAKILNTEALVLTHFDKASAGYSEFFPNGRTGYNNINKGNIDSLFDQAILAFTHHKDLFGEGLLQEFIALKSEYDAARQEQQQQKENKDGSANTWEEDLEAMNDQAFENLLTIARAYRGQPDRMRQYFDQSIITPVVHTAQETGSTFPDNGIPV